MQNGVRDGIEHINDRDLLHPTLRNKYLDPPLVQQHLPEIVDYFSFLHLNIVRKLTSLFDIHDVGGDVHEDQLELSGGGFGRAVLYYGMVALENAKTGNSWLRGHSHASALTFLTSQSMASLQIRDDHDGE
ncbi:oxoglutarate/iron-dependent oxygenase [Rhodotorula toruloides]|uniref:Oxoglutarate/iron-dependent oxygenase n=1 Tax=Rhodotorula toruloides TaxID=5286 RepID=A0A511KDX9_RHOTO|nr:oxoglutarate/iron-dependent oxygenase [Rhodotorula toruloides]